MKEPKLLSDIRTARAAAEKAARSEKAPEPQGPLMAGTVETPAVPNPPSNYLAQALEDCTTAAHCEELLQHAKQHGYDDGGQTVKLIRAKIAELGGGKATKARKRRGAR